MTTAVTDAATKAAFAQRYRTRPWHRFDLQEPGVQLRWTVVASKVVKGDVTSGKAFRDEYHRGFPGVKTWAEIGPDERDSWGAVYQAAVRAWHAAEQAERMADAA
jgi:hypothetical protein